MISEMQSVKLNESLLYDIAKRYRENVKISETCLSICLLIEARNKADLSDQE